MQNQNTELKAILNYHPVERTYSSEYDYSEVIECLQWDTPNGLANDLMCLHDSVVIMMEEIIMNDAIENKSKLILEGISGTLYNIRKISEALMAAELTKKEES